MSATSMNNRTLPFALRLDRSRPNAKTSAAMDEGDKIIASEKSRFNTPEEMFEDLGI